MSNSSNNSLYNLAGKRALVFGASKGIGKAIAELMAENGAQIIAVARNEEALQELVRSLPGTGHQFLAVDVSDLKRLSEKIQSVLQQGAVDIWINNSGGPKGGPITQADPNEMMLAFQQHLLSAQTVAQLLVPRMMEKKYGRIINIISTSVKTPLPNLGVSNTIRGATANWAKTLSLEVASHGITVNNVLPGYTKTERLSQLQEATATRLKQSSSQVEESWKASIPAGRFAEPREIAAAAVFLASPAASYVNGINLPVDGGRTPSL